MSIKPRVEEVLSTWELGYAICMSCDSWTRPPIPTAIILTPHIRKDIAGTDKSPGDAPAINTRRARDLPLALRWNSSEWHLERAMPAVQLPPMNVTLATAVSMSEIEVYWLNPNTTLKWMRIQVSVYSKYFICNRTKYSKDLYAG